jgi:alkyldihydroxyacetonephosphate synthase
VEAGRRSHWGWGHDAARPSGDALDGLAGLLSARFGEPATVRAPVPLEDVELPPSRVAPPSSLARLCRADPYERCLHHYGRSFRDVLRGSRGEFPHPPDLVAYPETEEDVVALLEWCSQAGIAALPYGGGSSVVGGVEPLVGDGFRGVVTLDLSRLAGVVELDRRSLAARVRAGTFGPALEDALRREGLTFRHFPQSFEFSTVGGWIATRSGGHFATRYTHVDDLLEAVRLVGPAGVLETRRVPASGAGPAPERLVLGSEGALGVVTEAWLRVRPRPDARARATLRFGSVERAVEAVRALAQSGLEPANCRLLDPAEALVGGAGDGSTAVVLVGFEAAGRPVGALLDAALEVVADHGAVVAEREVLDPPARAASGTALVTDSGSAGAPGAAPSGGGGGGAGPAGAAEAWRRSFLGAPYVRDALVLCGAVCETFETAVTWDRFEALDEAVRQAAAAAFAEATGGRGSVTCRFTHVYPDGPAPYYTVVAPGRAGAELEQWQVVKEACSDALLAAGGTITHHHAVGRDHLRWYLAERPPAFGAVLAAAKKLLDPAGVCNPGVLVPLA